MGRECRRVPPTWEHPRDESGKYIPLYDQDFQTSAEEWKEGFCQWEAGFSRDVLGEGFEPRDPRIEDGEFWEYHGSPPEREYYRPRWTDEEATHYQMYETTSEGTPISPVFATPEEVARWCADNGASAFGSQTASYEAWLEVARGRSTVSAMFSLGTGMISGVEAQHRMSREDH